MAIMSNDLEFIEDLERFLSKYGVKIGSPNEVVSVRIDCDANEVVRFTVGYLARCTGVSGNESA